MPIFGSSLGSHAELANPTHMNFPRTICAYGSRARGLTTKMTLGTEDKQLLWKVDGSYSGDIILYDRPDERSNMLGIVKAGSSFSRGSTVYVPPMGQGSQPIQEEFRTEKSVFSESHRFAIVTGYGHPERFEWKSNGVLGGVVGIKGYKLIRESTGETVAEWYGDWTGGIRTKVATFKFVGAGASGQLGDAWALMAVMTWLKLYQRYIQTATGLNAAAGAGAGAAAVSA